MRVCRRCGGSGLLLRPRKKKLLTFEECPRCEGKQLMPYEATLESFLREMRIEGRDIGRRLREE
jgi:hypothetical protein